MLAKLYCFFFGHEVEVWQPLRPWSRRVYCTRCNGDFGVHDEHGMLPWTPEMQAMYELQGIRIWPRPGEGKTAEASK